MTLAKGLSQPTMRSSGSLKKTDKINLLIGAEALSVEDRQAFPAKLVDDVEHAKIPSFVGPAPNEIVGPDMIGPLRPQADAGSVNTLTSNLHETVGSLTGRI